MNDTFFTGIDIGSEKIKIITLSNNSDNFMKTSNISRGILNGYIQNKKETSKSLTEVLIDAENKIKSPISKAIFGINSLGLTSRVLVTDKILSTKRPVEVTNEILQELKKKASLKQIPPLFDSLILLPIEYDLDGYKSYLNPIDSIALKISVKYLQILVPLNHIRMIENTAEISDIEIEDIFPTALASAMHILREEEKNAGSMYIDFGHSITTFVFIKNGQPYKIKSLDFGSDKLSEIIALKLKVSKKDAENMKKRPPLDSEKRELIGKIITNYIKKMLIEINKDIEKIEKISDKKDFFTSGIILAGAGSRLKDIEYVFSKLFKMPVRKITDPNIETEHTSYTGAYSIASKYKKNFRNKNNLLDNKNVNNIFSKIKKIFKK